MQKAKKTAISKLVNHQ